MIQDIAPHKYYVDYQPSVPNDTDLVLITVIIQFCAISKIPRSATLHCEIAAVFPRLKKRQNFCSALMRRTIMNCAVRSFRIWHLKYENILILRSAVPMAGFAITGYQITWYTDHIPTGRCCGLDTPEMNAR